LIIIHKYVFAESFNCLHFKVEFVVIAKSLLNHAAFYLLLTPASQFEEYIPLLDELSLANQVFFSSSFGLLFILEFLQEPEQFILGILFPKLLGSSHLMLFYL